MRVFVAALAVFALASVSSATSIVWTLDPAPTDFINGGGAHTTSDFGEVTSMELTWDTVTESFTEWEIVLTATGGGEFPADVFTEANSSIGPWGSGGAGRFFVGKGGASGFLLLSGNPTDLGMQNHSFITNGIHQQKSGFPFGAWSFAPSTPSSGSPAASSTAC